MIQIRGLQKVVGTQTILNIETFDVAGGEICAVVGPSGSGKALLLELLIGKQQPTLGDIRIETGPETDLSHRIGVLFADNGLFPRQTALENLKFHCRLYGLPIARSQEVLTMVGLQEHARTRAEQLSDGFARRLAFGRAILHAPGVLLLVEPFAGCDEASLMLLNRLIRGQSESGAAILMIADDEAHLAGLCDTIYRLQQGQTVKVEPENGDTTTLPFKIPVRLEGRVILLNPADILFADAADGRTQVWTASGSLPSQFTLSELEQRLSRSGFFRAHRSYLVNLQHVSEVIPYTRSSFSLRLDDPAGTKIPLSKTAAAELRELLDY